MDCLTAEKIINKGKIMYNDDQGNYDVIGDIHGHAIKLEKLLQKLEYTKTKQNFYSHPTRKVVFLGDFIDGGNEHKAVINIVKPMVDNGAAYAIMANHEFNAISFHTKHPKTGLPLRAHSDKNIKQHIEFITEYKNDNEEMLSVIDWFKTLPLFLDLPDIRAIHACWSDYEINKIKQYLNSDNVVKPELFEEFFVKSNTEKTSEFEAVEVLLKGVEIPLPDNKFFLDNKKTPRYGIRVKWWITDKDTYKEYALVPPGTIIPDIPLPKELLANYFYTDVKPVFVGHYWLDGKPKVQAKNIACLDYSAGKGGHQVAYRWNKNDKTLNDASFISME